MELTSAYCRTEDIGVLPIVVPELKFRDGKAADICG